MTTVEETIDLLPSPEDIDNDLVDSSDLDDMGEDSADMDCHLNKLPDATLSGDSSSSSTGGIHEAAQRTATDDSNSKTTVHKAGKLEKPPKKRTWKKPKDKPKRPLSAYNLFFQSEREKIVRQVCDPEEAEFLIGSASKQLTPSERRRRHRRSHGKIGFAALARNIAEKWKKLDSDSKTQFEAQASLEKERYKRELDDWKKQREVKRRLTQHQQEQQRAMLLKAQEHQLNLQNLSALEATLGLDPATSAQLLQADALSMLGGNIDSNSFGQLLSDTIAAQWASGHQGPRSRQPTMARHPGLSRALAEPNGIDMEPLTVGTATQHAGGESAAGQQALFEGLHDGIPGMNGFDNGNTSLNFPGLLGGARSGGRGSNARLQAAPMGGDPMSAQFLQNASSLLDEGNFQALSESLRKHQQLLDSTSAAATIMHPNASSTSGVNLEEQVEQNLDKDIVDLLATF